jgi:raffinose/stachyose/melibiose transport system permease protein
MRRLYKALSNMGVWFWTVLVFIPFIFIMLFGVKSTNDIVAKPLALFFHPWHAGPGSAGMGIWFFNTFVLVGVALLVSLGAAIPPAYFAIFLPQKVNQRVRVMILMGTTVPIILLVIPYFKTFDALGLINVPAATGVVYGVLAIPTTFLLMNRFFVDFPREVLEAGLVDGLTNVRIFTKLVLPLSIGQIVSVGILTLIWAWGDSQIAIVLLNRQTAQPISVGMLSFVGDFTVNLGATFAGLTLAAIPPIIIYIVLSKFVTKGIALGGISK